MGIRDIVSSSIGDMLTAGEMAPSQLTNDKEAALVINYIETEMRCRSVMEYDLLPSVDVQGVEKITSGIVKEVGRVMRMRGFETKVELGLPRITVKLRSDVITAILTGYDS